RVGCTGIIDFPGVTRMLAELLKQQFASSRIFLETEMKAFVHHADSIDIVTNRDSFRTRYLVTCAGLQSDRVACVARAIKDVIIIGFRGDYYDLTDKGMMKVRNLIYPVPNPQFPFLGVHFTRMINGGVECGPNAVFTFKREGYGKGSFSLRDTAEAFSYSGTWRFIRKHWRFGIDEYRSALSKPYFIERLRKLVPTLQSEDIVAGRCGVRATALDPEGEIIDDFKIEQNGNVINVINAPSPAATACLAIGKTIQDIATERFELSNA
ncbi:MAG: FAD-dependent oxidoreductase, partial [Gammaproteobacteria bacterium]